MSVVLTRSEWITWRVSHGARPGRAAVSTSMAIFWSSCRPAAGRPTGPVWWMRLRKLPGTIRASAVRNSDEAQMLKLPRTIRLDPSDTFVFERAAEPGEWAVSGAFVFWNRDLANLGQKQRVALRSGFLGVGSLGWSTLAIVTEASEADRQGMVEHL